MGALPLPFGVTNSYSAVNGHNEVCPESLNDWSTYCKVTPLRNKGLIASLTRLLEKYMAQSRCIGLYGPQNLSYSPTFLGAVMRLAIYFDYYKVCVFLPPGGWGPGLPVTLWGGVRFRVDDGWTADHLFTLGARWRKGVVSPEGGPLRLEGMRYVTFWSWSKPKNKYIYIYIHTVYI